MTSVEILYFDECPNYRRTIELVEDLLAERGLDAELRVTRVESPEAAVAARFLGSPTVRVNGADVEPGADARTDYVLACRVYRAAAGTSGIPHPAWIADALG